MGSMRRFIKIVFGTFPKLSLGAFLLIILSVALQLPLPLLTVYFIDKVLPSRNIGLLNLIGLALVGFLVLSVASGFINNYFHTLLFEKIAMKHGVLSFKSFLDSHLVSSFSRSPGYWTNRIQNDPQSVAQLFRTMIEITTQGLTLVVGLFFIFDFSVKLGLFVVFIIPFYACALFILGPKIRKQNKKAKEERSGLAGFIEESLSAFETVKVLSLEDLRGNQLENHWGNMVNENVRYSVLVSIGNLIATAIASIAPIGVLWYGGYLVMAGNLTLGELIGINKFISYVFKPIASVMGINARIQDAEVSLERIDEIVNLPKENYSGKEAQIRQDADIAIRSLNFSYSTEAGRVTVFNEFNFLIEGGKTTVIVGESGCGKSTLLRLIVGLLKPDSGEILIDGKDIAVLDVGCLRRQACLIPQNSYLFSGGLSNNITIGADGKNISQILLDATGVGKFTVLDAGADPGSVLELNVGSRGLNLSGGERQRVSLARALVRDPSVLLMDEVTSEIDLQTEREVIEKLNELRRGKTTVIVAHRLSAAIAADEIIVLSKGNILERGAHRELVSRKGTYYRMWLASQGSEVPRKATSTSTAMDLNLERIFPVDNNKKVR